MDKWFEVVNLSAKERGILKMVGSREIVISIKTLPGSDHADDEWLTESMKNLYMQYYSRVSEYSKQQ